MMNRFDQKPLYDFFAKDHCRLDRLLHLSIQTKDIQLDEYRNFRVGLLTHIKMEEKVFFLVARKSNNKNLIELASTLRLQHGALTSMMVLPPSQEVIKVTRHILDIHNVLEEKEGGMYDLCERLSFHQTQELLVQLDAVSETPLNPFSQTSVALDAAKVSLSRAGFNYDEIVAKSI